METEAWDTVIKNQNILDLSIPCEFCESQPIDLSTRACMECIALQHRRAQAEISFKMGYNRALRDINDGLSPSELLYWQK